jgi:cell division protein FtsB
MPAVPVRPTEVEPLRRSRLQGSSLSVVRRRTIHFLLVFVTVVLVVDALVGEKGLIETLRARRQYREVAASLEMLRHENGRLRDEVRRLNEDPATIEAVARRELGLVRPGEVLVVVKDATPAR